MAVFVGYRYLTTNTGTPEPWKVVMVSGTSIYIERADAPASPTWLVKYKLNADRAPTSGDDQTLGYSIGSFWTHGLTSYRAYLVDVNNAVWIAEPLTIQETNFILDKSAYVPPTTKIVTETDLSNTSKFIRTYPYAGAIFDRFLDEATRKCPGYPGSTVRSVASLRNTPVVMPAPTLAENVGYSREVDFTANIANRYTPLTMTWVHSATYRPQGVCFLGATTSLDVEKVVQQYEVSDVGTEHLKPVCHYNGWEPTGFTKGYRCQLTNMDWFLKILDIFCARTTGYHADTFVKLRDDFTRTGAFVYGYSPKNYCSKFNTLSTLYSMKYCNDIKSDLTLHTYTFDNRSYVYMSSIWHEYKFTHDVVSLLFTTVFYTGKWLSQYDFDMPEYSVFERTVNTINITDLRVDTVTALTPMILSLSAVPVEKFCNSKLVFETLKYYAGVSNNCKQLTVPLSFVPDWCRQVRLVSSDHQPPTYGRQHGVTFAFGIKAQGRTGAEPFPIWETPNNLGWLRTSKPINFKLTAVNPRHGHDDKPIKYFIDNGALPQGILLSEDGVLSGTTLVEGHAEFTVSAVDENGSRSYRTFYCEFAPGPLIEVTGDNVYVNNDEQYAIFDASGADQILTVSRMPATLTLHLWGAGGAGGRWITHTWSVWDVIKYEHGPSMGGAGAYASGQMYVPPGRQVTVKVGVGGQTKFGGWPNGGSGSRNGLEYGGGGGGRTEISIQSVIANDPNLADILESYTVDVFDSPVLVAGAGGGGSQGMGGAGGFDGQDGRDGDGTDIGGKPGTQYDGGLASNPTNAPTPPKNGQRFEGGLGVQRGAGGGDGYYGGGGTSRGGAGGGSSYSHPKLIINPTFVDGTGVMPGNPSIEVGWSDGIGVGGDRWQDGSGDGLDIRTSGGDGRVVITWE